MSEIDLQNIAVLSGYHGLSETQKAQFKRVIMEGLNGKFARTLPDDEKSILRIIDIWIKYDFLPMDETFCAADETGGDVLAILLLNNFKKPGPFQSLFCLISVMKAIGAGKALRLAFSFLRLDNLNKEQKDERIAAEIYLVSTRADMRGKGIGTLLMNRVLERIDAEYASRTEDGYRVKLLVFAKNPALRMYERLGFKPVKSVDTPRMAQAFGDEYDALVFMERAL